MPVRLKDILQTCAPVAPDTRAAQLAQRFLAEPDLSAIPVVFQRTAVGLVTRAGVFELVARAGSHALTKLPTSRIMDSDPQIADSEEILARLCHMQSGSAANRVFRDGLIVTERGQYRGYVPSEAIGRALAGETTARVRALHQLREQTTRLQRDADDHQRAQIGHLAALGHEIRTPLTVMLGHADRLASISELPGPARDSARQLAEAAHSLSQLANDFVEAGEVGLSAVRINTSACAVRDLATTLIELWRPAALARDLELKLSVARRVPERLLIDPARIQQILGNLLSNAIKHTHFGVIELSFDWEGDAENGSLVIQVRDTGPGLSPAAAERLFQPFARAEDRSDIGTGLGLYISHTLAQRMEGELSYAPGTEGGSIFTLHLPATAARPRLAVQAPMERRRGAFDLGTVLIVDDHDSSRWLIAKALSEAGWQVEEATSLEQARQKADQTPYQAILCDLHLQDGDGETLARDLRAGFGANWDGLLLALSADGRAARREACLDAGFDGFMAKPIRAGELVTQLADFIAMPRATDTPLRRRA